MTTNEDQDRLLIQVDSTGTASLPKRLFKHRKYQVQRKPDDVLVFMPVAGTEFETKEKADE